MSKLILLATLSGARGLCEYAAGGHAAGGHGSSGVDSYLQYRRRSSTDEGQALRACGTLATHGLLYLRRAARGPRSIRRRQ